MRRMGVVVVCMAAVAAVLVCFAAGALSPTPLAEAWREGDVLRLHIIANSDSDKDQATKLAVRDALLAELGDELASAGSAAAAEKVVEENRERIIAAARRAGHEGAISVQVGSWHFPAKRYGDTLLPEGEYRAVRIVLGSGEGANWFCVMYPPLCVGDISPDTVPEVRSYLLDIIRGKIEEWRARYGGDIWKKLGL